MGGTVGVNDVINEHVIKPVHSQASRDLIQCDTRHDIFVLFLHVISMIMITWFPTLIVLGEGEAEVESHRIDQ